LRIFNTEFTISLLHYGFWEAPTQSRKGEEYDWMERMPR
jgi:hypothetical protein